MRISEDVNSLLKKLGMWLLLLCLMAGGCTKIADASIDKKTNQDDNVTHIKFIVPDEKYMDWKVDDKPIKDCTAEAVVNELLKYPHTYPKGAKLLNIEVKDKIAYVDMSPEFETYDFGSTGVYFELYTIVNTLCLNEILGIDRVRFLLSGEKVDIIGEFMVDEALGPTIKPEELGNNKYIEVK